MIVELDKNGKIIRVIRDTSAPLNIESVSEILDRGNILYLGSFRAPYIGSLHVWCSGKDPAITAACLYFISPYFFEHVQCKYEYFQMFKTSGKTLLSTNLMMLLGLCVCITQLIDVTEFTSRIWKYGKVILIQFALKWKVMTTTIEKNINAIGNEEKLWK